MRLVRCEQCGAKALIAASQCPRCTHPLDLRDTRGNAVPLAYCPECDTYYPRSRGGCKWCGTKPAAIPVNPWKVWAGIGAGVVILALGIWQYRVYASSRAAAAVGANATEPVAAVPEPVASPPAAAPARADTAMGEEEDSLAEGVGGAESLKVRITGGVTASPAVGAPGGAGSGGGVSGAAGGGGAPSEGRGVVPAGTSTPRGEYRGPWTRAVAIEWVNVRTEASRDAAVAGVVTPGTAVQLGETRAGWRRVRSAGVEGWADTRFFTADTVVRR